MELSSAFVTSLASVVGLVFTYAVLSKLKEFTKFVAAFRGYEIVPRQAVVPGAIVLLLAEAVIAASHLSHVGLIVVAPFALLLLFAFFVVMFILMSRPVDHACLCFGINPDKRLNNRTMVRLGLLIVVESAVFVTVVISDSGSIVAFDGTAEILESALHAGLIVAIATFGLSVPELRYLNIRARRIRRRFRA